MIPPTFSDEDRDNGGEPEHGDELQQLLSAVERIADGIGGLHELAVAVVSRPDFVRAGSGSTDDADLIKRLRDELQAARTMNVEIVALPVGILARTLTLIGRSQ